MNHGKKWACALVACSALCVSCAPGNNTGGATLLGAATGGLVGGALFHGHNAWMGVAGGALIGGLIGHGIGNRMDETDYQNMNRAMDSESERSWTNHHSHITYTVRPIGHRYSYHSHHNCRRYKTSVLIDGQLKYAYGKACRINGQWRVVQ